MTARGVLSSWEAEATKAVCFFWFSIIGFKSFPVNTHEKAARKITAIKFIRAKSILCS